MADEWFYTQNGQQCGPVDFSQLQSMASGGAIHPNDLIWKQGMTNWAAASTVPGVFQAAPPPPMPSAPGYPPPPQPPPQGFPQPGAYPMNYQPMGPMGPVSPHIGMARTAMILALVGILCAGPLTGLLAVIFGGIALSGMGKTGDNRGHGMAVTGLVLGIIDIFFGIIGLLMWMHHHH